MDWANGITDPIGLRRTTLAHTLFADARAVAMIGDSITFTSHWWGRVREQVLLRFPEAPCEFHNCGIPGGSAEGALRRYDWDIAPLRPDLAFVMFGMNDVDRALYATSADAAVFERRADALRRFLVATETLVRRLLSDGVRVVLLPPTPFDQYAVRESVPKLFGVDDALAICGGMVRGIGRALNLPVVDFHTRLRHRVMSGEPLIADDRTHPTESGQDAMAAIVIETLLDGVRREVPPDLRKAVVALQQREENDLRILAMVRSWMPDSTDRFDAAAVLDFIARRLATEANPWVRDHLLRCPDLIARENDLLTTLAALRGKITEARPRRDHSGLVKS